MLTTGQNRSQIGYLFKGFSVPVSGANPDALIFSLGDQMYKYQIYAKFENNEEKIIMTFFDDQYDNPMEEARTYIQNNTARFVSARIEKSIVPML